MIIFMILTTMITWVSTQVCSQIAIRAKYSSVKAISKFVSITRYCTAMMMVMMMPKVIMMMMNMMMINHLLMKDTLWESWATGYHIAGVPDGVGCPACVLLHAFLLFMFSISLSIFASTSLGAQLDALQGSWLHPLCLRHSGHMIPAASSQPCRQLQLTSDKQAR